MILIAHRGNTSGPSMFENEPGYLTAAIKEGYKVEVDVWVENGKMRFGHDGPDHAVPAGWMALYASDCIFHCKNLGALVAMQEAGHHYFWHQEDEYTITSKGYVWVYPGRPFPSIQKFIACQPGYIDSSVDRDNLGGICSDYVSSLRQKKEE